MLRLSVRMKGCQSKALMFLLTAQKTDSAPQNHVGCMPCPPMSVPCTTKTSHGALLISSQYKRLNTVLLRRFGACVFSRLKKERYYHFLFGEMEKQLMIGEI